MRRLILLTLLVACAGKSATAPPEVVPGKPKPDPFVSIRVQNMLDTMTAMGRAHWHVYVLLTGPLVKQNGISFQGSVSLADVRVQHSVLCSFVGADSIGTRLISVLAVADTSTDSLTADAPAGEIAAKWYAGDVVLPKGWAALVNAPMDAFNAQQYAAGKGLVPNDPIKWNLEWAGRGTVNFYERPADDKGVC